MSTVELRHRAKKAIDEISGNRLKFVNEFLDYVKVHGPQDATSELLNIKGFHRSFRRGEKDLRAGRLTNWRKVRSNV